jgi:hypothetical protein
MKGVRSLSLAAPASPSPATAPTSALSTFTFSPSPLSLFTPPSSPVHVRGTGIRQDPLTFIEDEEEEVEIVEEEVEEEEEGEGDSVEGEQGSDGEHGDSNAGGEEEGQEIEEEEEEEEEEEGGSEVKPSSPAHPCSSCASLRGVPAPFMAPPGWYPPGVVPPQGSGSPFYRPPWAYAYTSAGVSPGVQLRAAPAPQFDARAAAGSPTVTPFAAALTAPSPTVDGWRQFHQLQGYTRAMIRAHEALRKENGELKSSLGEAEAKAARQSNAALLARVQRSKRGKILREKRRLARNALMESYKSRGIAFDRVTGPNGRVVIIPKSG